MMQSTPPPKTAQDILNEDLKQKMVYEQRLTKKELDKHPGLEPKIEISGNGDFFLGKNGVNFNGNLDASNKNFEITSMLDAGYMGDLEERGRLDRILSETHGYAFRNSLVHPAVELDIFTHGDEKLKLWLGGATKPIKIGGIGEVSADFYPVSTENGKLSAAQKQLWLNGNLKLSKKVSIGGIAKYFFKKGSEDTVLGKVGIKYDMGNGFCVKGEYRNWPIKTPTGVRRDHSVYIGVGYGGNYKKLPK
ncbi:MAG: hypothetical protein JSV39_01325 [Candidatus Aenigmatarchaeota archaeon]|nr:MAG: hypothetical protein JSV39_01325 [Candidatus Aenigmarchaeota archaeon]